MFLKKTKEKRTNELIDGIETIEKVKWRKEMTNRFA